MAAKKKQPGDQFRSERLETYQEMADFISCSRSYFCTKILPLWREAGVVIEAPRRNGSAIRRVWAYKDMVKAWIVLHSARNNNKL